MAENTATAEAMAMPKHGEFCWTEIATNNLEACKSFYANVFGWEMQQSKATGEEMEYQEFNIQNGQPMGGMFQMQAEMYGGEIPPPHFVNYVAVENVDDSASKAFDLGGTIVSPPMDIPNVGRFAIIKDPTGADISIISLSEGGQQ